MPLPSLVNDAPLVQSGDQLRAYPRYPFRRWQRVAFGAPGVPLDKLNFETVLFNDISRAGFSFFSANFPTGDTLVAEIGESQMVRVTALVKHFYAVEHAGQPRILIGCQYTGRCP